MDPTDRTITSSSRRPWLWLATGVLVAALAMSTLLPAIAAAPSPDPLPEIAFVARNDVPFDALSVGPVAGALGAVTIITPSSALSQDAEDGLRDFTPDRVYIVGGEAAISSSTEQEIDDAGGWDVIRIAGSNRDDTARQLAELPQTLGYGRPVVTQNGTVFGMWADDYAAHGHDHGINPGAGGDEVRRGGVTSETVLERLDSSWTVLAELTIPAGNLVSNCPAGTPLHNFLVESSGGVVTKDTDDATAELALTLDQTTWSAGDGATFDDGAIRRVHAPGGTTDVVFSSHMLATTSQGDEHVFRLLGRKIAGPNPINAAERTLVVQHLGYECSP